MGSPGGASGSNFRWGMLLMPRSARPAIASIYRFCRAADDAVDAGDPVTAQDRLGHWREELDLLYRNSPRAGLMKDLYVHVREHRLNREYFTLLLEGIEWDLRKRRYADGDELLSYCDRVAGAVGLLCLQVLGLHEDGRAKEYSKALSYGLQLTNILRDVGQDAPNGRLYWPEAEMEAFGYSSDQLRKRKVTEGYFKAARFQVKRAQSFLDKAEMITVDHPDLRKRLLGPEIMRETYESLLRKIEKEHDRALDGEPARLSGGDKIAIAAGTWLRVALT
jgi:phytoene synthase